MRSMQCFAFGPSSIKTEIPRYHPISGQDSNSHGNIPVTNEMELSSSHTLSLDQILTNSFDVTPSASFGYSQVSTSTDSASFNSMTSSFECKPSRSTNPTSTNILGTTNSLTSPFTYISTWTDSDVNIFERQQSPVLKPSWEQDDKIFAERTILLPNPKSPRCYFPPVSNVETVHDIQCSNRMTCAEAPLNSTLSDCYFQIGSVSEPNQATTTSFVASRPQVDSVCNSETDSKGKYKNFVLDLYKDLSVIFQSNGVNSPVGEPLIHADEIHHDLVSVAKKSLQIGGHRLRFDQRRVMLFNRSTCYA